MNINFRKKRVWVSIFSLIAVIANAWGLWTYIGIDETQYTELVNAVLTLLIAIGFIPDRKINEDDKTE